METTKVCMGYAWHVPLHVAQLEVRYYDFIPDLSEQTLHLAAWT